MLKIQYKTRKGKIIRIDDQWVTSKDDLGRSHHYLISENGDIKSGYYKGLNVTEMGDIKDISDKPIGTKFITKGGKVWVKNHNNSWSYGSYKYWADDKKVLKELQSGGHFEDEPKVEPKPEPKVEPKPQPKVEPKVEPKIKLPPIKSVFGGKAFDTIRNSDMPIKEKVKQIDQLLSFMPDDYIVVINGQEYIHSKNGWDNNIDQKHVAMSMAIAKNVEIKKNINTNVSDIKQAKTVGEVKAVLQKAKIGDVVEVKSVLQKAKIGDVVEVKSDNATFKATFMGDRWISREFGEFVLDKSDYQHKNLANIVWNAMDSKGEVNLITPKAIKMTKGKNQKEPPMQKEYENAIKSGNMEDFVKTLPKGCKLISKKGDEHGLPVNAKGFYYMKKGEQVIVSPDGEVLADGISVGMFPKTVAGVKQGVQMTHEEADNRNANPNYAKGEEYKINCQTCVLAYEMRRRGYNVEAIGNTGANKCYELSWGSNQAYIDPKTHRPIEYEFSYYGGPYTTTSTGKAVREYAEKLPDNSRHIFRFNHNSGGHIINLIKEDGQVFLYDPQNNKSTTNIEEYINEHHAHNIAIARVDNKEISAYYVNDILKGK